MGIIEGLPANVAIDVDAVNLELQRRQRVQGRGGRMSIESDRVEILSGLRGGRTLGSPLTLKINNRDYTNWQNVMDPLIPWEGTRSLTHARVMLTTRV